MSHENQADQSAFLQAACTKSKCIELLALAADYREALPQVLELLRQKRSAFMSAVSRIQTDGRKPAVFLLLLFLRRICTENCRWSIPVR